MVPVNQQVGSTVQRVTEICWGWWLLGVGALSSSLNRAGTPVLAAEGDAQQSQWRTAQGDATWLERVLPGGWGCLPPPRPRLVSPVSLRKEPRHPLPGAEPVFAGRKKYKHGRTRGAALDWQHGTKAAGCPLRSPCSPVGWVLGTVRSLCPFLGMACLAIVARDEGLSMCPWGWGQEGPACTLPLHHPSRVAPGARLAVPARSHSNPKTLLQHRPSTLEHRLAAGKGALGLGLVLALFLEKFPSPWRFWGEPPISTSARRKSNTE